MKKVLAFTAAVLLTVGAASTLMAAKADKAAKPTNTVCPVKGKDVDPSSAKVVTHKGKAYAVCCGSCVRKFNENPEQYAK